MNELQSPQQACEAYQGKVKHLALTIPLLIVIILLFLYIASVNLIFAIIYLGLYVATNIFQAYCCVYQDCPYIGKYCPGIACLYPASILAQLSFYRNMKRTEKRFNTFVTLGEVSLLGFVLLPLLFLFSLGLVYFVGYIIFILVYAVLFLWFICPDCAIKNTCPGGIASQKLRKNQD